MDSNGFSSLWNFLYLPVDFKSHVAIGYAILNFTSHAVAERAFATFNGFSAWKGNSKKICEVSWSETEQGLDANIERFRNCPMNRRKGAPEECKPIIIENGK